MDPKIYDSILLFYQRAIDSLPARASWLEVIVNVKSMECAFCYGKMSKSSRSFRAKLDVSKIPAWNTRTLLNTLVSRAIQNAMRGIPEFYFRKFSSPRRDCWLHGERKSIAKEARRRLHSSERIPSFGLLSVSSSPSLLPSWQLRTFSSSLAPDVTRLPWNHPEPQ